MNMIYPSFHVAQQAARMAREVAWILSGAKTANPSAAMGAASIGFEYLIEHIREGRVIDQEFRHNIIPLEGLNYLLNSEFKGTAVPATWYIGLFEGNYTPQLSDTAAAFPAAATETSTFNEATRVAFVPGAVSGGTLDNSAAPATFTFNAPKTIYGGFMTSASAKGAVTGTLISAVRFASPKTPATGDLLKVTGGFVFASS